MCFFAAGDVKEFAFVLLPLDDIECLAPREPLRPYAGVSDLDPQAVEPSPDAVSAGLIGSSRCIFPAIGLTESWLEAVWMSR